MSASTSPKRGLSVIEALVAIAVLGLALSGLMSWRQAVLRQHRMIEAHEHIVRAHRNALALLSGTNPMLEPAGVRDIALGQRVCWRATPLSRTASSRAYPAGEGAFTVALYRRDIRVESAGREPVTFSIERVGWSPTENANEVR